MYIDDDGDGWLYITTMGNIWLIFMMMIIVIFFK